MEKKYRIRKNMEFIDVYNKRNKAWNRVFIIYKSKNSLDYNKFGFSISKKHGKAIVRNKLKRRLKNIAINNIDNMKKGYNLVFVPKTGITELDYKELEKSFIHVLKKAELWEN